jgi:uncharacterized protein (TIGR03118 family)
LFADLANRLHSSLNSLTDTDPAVAPVSSSTDVSQGSGFGVNPNGTRFIQTNLVTDGLEPAANTDTLLVNPWGLASSPTGSPFWVSDNNSGFATLYTSNGTPQSLQVQIAAPPGQTTPAAPTGVVFNTFAADNAFMLNGKPANFIFDTEDGTISAWNGGTTTTIEVDNSNNPFAGADGNGAVYKGLAIANTSNGPDLFAANFRHGTVDVFNSNFQQIGDFTDPNVPKGYAPFDVQALNGNLFVTYALQNATKHDDVAGKHHGFVDEFNTNGQLIARVASGGPLDSPWGLAIAPQDFGKFAGDLLVGNFGDGRINAYDLASDKFVGQLQDQDGKALVIPDLWALRPGNSGAGGSPNSIYFTSGVQNEAHGLFGALDPAPNLNSGMSMT